MAKIPPGVGPKYPQVVVLVGATGDLARRKLLPGLFHLSRAGFIPGCRIIGVSLDDMDADGFRENRARARSIEFSTRKVERRRLGMPSRKTLDYVPLGRGRRRAQGGGRQKRSKRSAARAAGCTT